MVDPEASGARPVVRWLRWLGFAVAGLVAALVVWVVAGAVVYSPEYVARVLAWGESDIGDYLERFPNSPLTASQSPFVFADGDDDEHVRSVFAAAFGVEDLEMFLVDSGTQAFIVIKDDAVVYEEYFNDTARDSMLSSCSVDKSFDSALIGIAIDEGHITSVDDAVTTYLPELLDQDEAFGQITIRDLLLMAAGLEYQDMRWWLFNGDDPLTTYYPDQREIGGEESHAGGSEKVHLRHRLLGEQHATGLAEGAGDPAGDAPLGGPTILGVGTAEVDDHGDAGAGQDDARGFPGCEPLVQ